jgi:8-oxo-dGTP diphosphatase
MLEKESGRYLITQRSKTSSLPLLWEFPGGRVQDGETDEAALKRELKERLHIDVVV